MKCVGLAIALLSGGLVLLPLTAAGAPPLYSISREDDLLRVIDPADGTTIGAPIAITLPGSTVFGGTGLVTHPQTGVIYALVKLVEFAGPHRWLVTIDPSTGDASTVGNTLDKFAGLAFDPNGTLYAVTGKGAAVKATLYTLSLSDATPAFVTSLGDPNAPGEAIGFNPDDGFLYRAAGLNDGLQETRLFEKIDLNTLAVTNIPLSGDSYSEITALVFSDGGFLAADNEFGAEAEVLLSLTVGGVVNLIGSTDHIAKGLAFGPPDPIPSLDNRGRALLAIALLALATVTFGGRLRRRPDRGGV